MMDEKISRSLELKRASVLASGIAVPTEEMTLVGCCHFDGVRLLRIKVYKGRLRNLAYC